MRRWSINGEVENAKIDAFLDEIWAVCERHGLALSHEDQHGAFEIVPLAEGNRDWLMEAHDRATPPELAEQSARPAQQPDPARSQDRFNSLVRGIRAKMETP